MPRLRQTKIHLATAERKAFSTDQVEVGASLAGYWNLPPNMVVPIRYLHYLDLDEELALYVRDLYLSFSVHPLNVSSLITDVIYD
jgi:hypothetical protein